MAPNERQTKEQTEGVGTGPKVEAPAFEINQIHTPDEGHEPTPSPNWIPHPSGNGVLIVRRYGYQLDHVPGRKETCEAHRFVDLKSLARWLNRYGDPETVQILFGEDKVEAALEPRRVNERRVTCDIVAHPTFVAWRDVIDGSPLTQLQFLNLLRGFGSAFEDSLAAEALSGELLKIKVAEGRDMTVEYDATGLAKYHGGEQRKSAGGSIKPSFQLNLPVVLGVMKEPHYTGADEHEATYDIEILVSMSVDEGRALFDLSAPRLTLVLLEARRDAAKYLERQLEDGFQVLLGKYNSTLETTIYSMTAQDPFEQAEPEWLDGDPDPPEGPGLPDADTAPTVDADEGL